jgi:cytochrome c-type biogenesis protein CcmF
MIPELGHFALWLALGTAAALASVPMLGAARGRADWMALARPAAHLLFGFLAVAFACLAASFIGSDFSVLYVAANSNRALPLAYRFAAVWGGHEGSMLLWVLILGLWILAVARLSERLPADVLARTLSVMGFLTFGLLLFVLLASNPFTRLFPAPADGRDLNPLLQDPGMVIHPPVLYMGYVGLSVAFSFAVGALIGGKLDATWARWTRPWTTAAWVFLTIGIALGSGWAYYELGWGGWWFWDPVENASFMPWLAATALIHSLAVTEKRGAFKAWTVLLAIVAFSLSLLGTFLVRSGVLSSVHAFASDPRRGLFILGLLAIVIGASLALYAWRAPSFGLGGRFATMSRETLLLANNVLLLAACGAVLLGTLYPLVLDALGLGKVSVGPPYFETVFVPLLAPMVFLLGVGPLARWKEASLPDLARRLKAAFACAVAAAIAIGLWRGHLTFAACLGLAMAAWIVASTAALLIEHLKVRDGGPIAVRRLGLLPRATAGMMVAHVGVAVFILGVTLVRSGQAERDVTVSIGQSSDLAGYRFVFRGVQAVAGPNYRAAQGLIEVERDGEHVATLRPEKRVYPASGSTLTEAAIDSSVTRDLYVSLGEPLAGGAWAVRLQVKPFVSWIWAGCALMALGGAVAASDRRYRRQRAAAPALEPQAARWAA